MYIDTMGTLLFNGRVRMDALAPALKTAGAREMARVAYIAPDAMADQ
jgi:hypothetical protein